MRSVTLRDVAAAAGVSVTTVSDSLSGKGRLPAETRTRIREVARELGYRPSVAARTLRRGRSGVLVISMPPSGAGAESLWQVDFFMKVLTGAAMEASARGYALAVAPTPLPADLGYDGMIAVDPGDGDALLRQAHERARPIVTVGRCDSYRTNWVDNDYDRLIPEALDTFVRRGAARPALIVHGSDASYVRDVEERYRAWCGGHGADPLIEHVPTGYVREHGRATARRLLSGPGRPDAVFAALDQLAIGMLAAAGDLGLRVPDDLLLLSLGDSPSVAHAPVPISALELHAEEIGGTAVSVLIDQIDADGPLQSRVVPGELVERASTVRPG